MKRANEIGYIYYPDQDKIKPISYSAYLLEFWTKKHPYHQGAPEMIKVVPARKDTNLFQLRVYSEDRTEVFFWDDNHGEGYTAMEAEIVLLESAERRYMADSGEFAWPFYTKDSLADFYSSLRDLSLEEALGHVEKIINDETTSSSDSFVNKMKAAVEREDQARKLAVTLEPLREPWRTTCHRLGRSIGERIDCQVFFRAVEIVREKIPVMIVSIFTLYL